MTTKPPGPGGGGRVPSGDEVARGIRDAVQEAGGATESKDSPGAAILGDWLREGFCPDCCVRHGRMTVVEQHGQVFACPVCGSAFEAE